MKDHAFFQEKIIRNYWKLVGIVQKSSYQNHLARKADTYAEASSGGVYLSLFKLWFLGVGCGHYGMVEF